MPSNVINLNAKLAAREDHRALTPKQEISIKLRNHFIEQLRLKRAAEFHRLSYKQRVRDLVKLTELIEIQEERLLNR
jgi:hypothetical protein